MKNLKFNVVSYVLNVIIFFMVLFLLLKLSLVYSIFLVVFFLLTLIKYIEKLKMINCYKRLVITKKNHIETGNFF